MIRGYTQAARIRHGTDDLVVARLFSGFDGIVHIAEEWMNFIERNFLVCGNECVFRFERFGKSITIVVFDF